LSLLTQQECDPLHTKKRGNSAEITRFLLNLIYVEITYRLNSKGRYSDGNKIQFICSLNRRIIPWSTKQMTYILVINAS
jgi:hypothetical protein